MAETFPITQARQELGFTPSTAVRANIDVRGTGGIGGAVGQAVLGGTGTVQGILQKRQQMQDDNSNTEADNMRTLADIEFEQFKLDNPQDAWHGFRQEQTQRVANEVGGLKFSNAALTKQTVLSAMYSDESSANALIDATRQLRRETLLIQTDALVEAFAQDDPQKKIDQINQYRTSEATKAFGPEIIARNIKAAMQAGTIKNLKGRIILDPTGTKKMLQDELEARKKGEQTELQKALPNTEDIDDLIDFARAEQSQEEMDKRAVEQGAKEVIQQELWGQLQDDNFGKALESVQSSDLPVTGEGGKKWWTDLIKKTEKAVLAGEESPLNQTNSVAYFELRRKIATDRKAVTENDLARKVGHGISIGDYEKLLGMITDDVDPLNSRTANRAEEYLKLFKKDNADGWLEIQNDYDKFFTDFLKQNKRPPTDRESEDYLRFLTTEPVRSIWRNDLPDEQVNIALRGLPLEGKRAFVEEQRKGIIKGIGSSTTAWLKKWRKKDKKITVDVATHYLSIAGGDRGKAINLAKKDGYTE